MIYSKHNVPNELGFLQSSDGRLSRNVNGAGHVHVCSGRNPAAANQLYSDGRRSDEPPVGENTRFYPYQPVALGQTNFAFDKGHTIGKEISYNEAAIAVAFFLRLPQIPPDYVDSANIVYSDAALKDTRTFRDSPEEALIKLFSSDESPLSKVPNFITKNQLARGLELFLASHNSVEMANRVAAEFSNENPQKPLVNEVSSDNIARTYFELTRHFIIQLVDGKEILKAIGTNMSDSQQSWSSVCAEFSGNLRKGKLDESVFKTCQALLSAGINAKALSPS